MVSILYLVELVLVPGVQALTSRFEKEWSTAIANLFHSFKCVEIITIRLLKVHSEFGDDFVTSWKKKKCKWIFCKIVFTNFKAPKEAFLKMYFFIHCSPESILQVEVLVFDISRYDSKPSESMCLRQ